MSPADSCKFFKELIMGFSAGGIIQIYIAGISFQTLNIIDLIYCFIKNIQTES